MNKFFIKKYDYNNLNKKNICRVENNHKIQFLKNLVQNDKLEKKNDKKNRFVSTRDNMSNS
jgi:hypothetical protein